ncbi:hypothetical protein [Mucilaginibacter sp. SP1R1]|uniref:hypothetical protein n=1 Tax=Mucilaginibacter sp. SP1R1 TaxID=2723091 RepID=UPI001612426A|nr:hypothetical protein [Mucilaginibacter sp. SP1R1]MBB6149780.1 hypothetical protein [Mucilaginibacter sp. SP1R1]
MKKTLTLAALLLIACLTSFAQNIVNPYIENRDDWSSSIKKIETDKQFTIVSIEYTANNPGSWVQLNKEIFIQTDLNNEHYNYIKSENIAMVPEKRTLAKAGEKLNFKIYFKKIPATAKSIDIIERAGVQKNGITFFNFYNVSLTQSVPEETTTSVKVTEVVLVPPPPVPQNGYTTTTTMPNQPSDGTNEMANAMNMMGPMYTKMATSMLDAQLSYYQQPGKIAEVAKLISQYYSALKKEGFTHDDVIKIITSESWLPKLSPTGGK